MITLTEKNTPILKQSAKAIAEWWTEKMQLPFNWNNGDDSPTGAMTFMLGNMVSQQAQQTITPQKIEKFKEYLSNSIMLLLANREYGSVRYIGVDYDPCPILANACAEADIDPRCLPVKSSIWLEENGNVIAAYQYGGERKLIFDA